MIRWINEYLGTAAFSATTETSEYGRVDVRDFVDESGNSVENILNKMEEALAVIREGKKVVICCHYGMSRSNSLAAAILATHEQMPFANAVRLVLSATDETEMRIGFLKDVQKAVGTNIFPQISKKTKKGVNKRILMTGSSGFIGSELISQISPELNIVSPKRKELDIITKSVLLDLLVKKEGVSTVIHLANPRKYSNVKAMGQAIVMLKNVLEVAKNNGLDLIYLSSWTVYSGYISSELLASEELPIRPKGTYSETKALCEMLVNFYRSNFGVKCLMLRVCPVYGVGSEKPAFIYTFLERILEGKTMHTHHYLNGEPKLDLLHVRDVAGAIRCLLKTDIETSRDFNIGSGSLHSTRTIAEILKEICGSSSHIEEQQVADYVGNIVMDSRSAQQCLGWNPEVDLREGLEEVYASVLEKYKNNPDM